MLVVRSMIRESGIPIRVDGNDDRRMNLSTRLTLAMVTLVLAASAAVGLLGYYNAEAALLPGVFERVETRVRARAADLDTSLSSVRSDALALQGLPAQQGIAGPVFSSCLRLRLGGGRG